MSRAHEFDFDLMNALSRESPVEFARRREALIQEAITSFHRPERGYQLQAAIDALHLDPVRAKSANAANGEPMADLAVLLSTMIRRIRAGDESSGHSIEAIAPQHSGCSADASNR